MTSPLVPLTEPLNMRRGPAWPNRFTLAPLTNHQSNTDGTLSDAEYTWLTSRAAGGFGMTMTCAAHVTRTGQGFPGQLGVFSDDHLPGLTRLAEGIRAEGSVSIVQLQHAGNRSPVELIGEAPVAPSEDGRGARALTLDEVEQTRDAFIDAAVRCEQAGFDGVQIHAAHGYLVCAFLSPKLNQRTDAYGGALDNRFRFLDEIIDGVRTQCGPDFTVGVRISPERFGLQLTDQIEVGRRLLVDERLDFVDVSLWDCFKEPNDEAYQGTLLGEYFAALPRDGVAMGVAGKLYSSADLERVLTGFSQQVDFVAIGRAAILHHDMPRLALAGPAWKMATLPVTRQHLADQYLSEPFIDYMASWDGFVETDR